MKLTIPLSISIYLLMTNCHCLNSDLKCTTSKDGVRLVTSKYLACGKAGRVLYAGSDLSYHYFTHFGKNVVPGMYQWL